MIYTIVDLSVIFGKEFKDISEYCDNIQLENKTEEINYDGRLFEATNNKNGTYTISRLISSEPVSFLNSKYSPGSVIRL